MLRDVNINIEDGKLNPAVSLADGIHVKIGVSPKHDVTVIQQGTSLQKLIEKLGNCPLSDAAMDSIENGAGLMYCIPVNASTAGTFSEVSKFEASTGALTVNGNPTNSFDVVVNIVTGGAVNEAVFNYSLDAGLTKSNEMTIPLNGVYTIENIGITLTFAQGEATYVAGSKYSFVATAPKASNADILIALEKLKTFNKEYEFVHIVGESTSDLWSAVSAFQEELESVYKNPVMFLVEAPKISASQNIIDYVGYLTSERKKVTNFNIALVSARGSYKKMNKLTVEQNLASVIAGLISKSKVQESIGQVAKYPIDERKLVKLMPFDIEKYLNELDEADLITIRQYMSSSSFYVSNANVLHKENSDYKYVEDARTVNKICREVRKASLPLLQIDINMSDTQKELEKFSEYLKVPLEKMVTNNEISFFELTIPANQDVALTETMNVEIKYCARGIVREIQIGLSRTY